VIFIYDVSLECEFGQALFLNLHLSESNNKVRVIIFAPKQ
jgi:hypothetical protein